MEERRRIIIPTGVERDHSLPVPQFDTEATLLARPVVPLVEAQRPARTNLLLVLVVVAASLVGAAAALAFDSFRNHTHQNAPVAQQPANAPAPVPQATQPEPSQENVAPPKIEDHQATVPAKPKPSPDERATGDDDSWTRDEPGAGDRAAKKSRAERRRRNDNEYGPEEVQRQVERAGRELNRIREIFEGRQQPQQPPE
ncbi:MAG: hypothetical protein AUG51_13265 [Acidobacteria bacterium 13_1_20CM_3_53_8]|nr:MAG: hypothetical protein AUG51_13265 [Acidobacteria bacterium 13_1_20CM_3_53_8]